jgi:penicillin V acylase-like amidase (Ntn superfamily)
MFMPSSVLAEKEKELIPIGTSLVVNFFIDHFKCIDTALLAIWDIRVFDDRDGESSWPFRLVLRDSTGSTAYLEYVNGKKRVYTPESPACIVSGPDYAHLLTIKYITDSLPKTKAEKRFIQVSESLNNIETDSIRKNTFAFFNSLEKISDNGFIIFRAHGKVLSTWHIIFNKQHVEDPVYILDNISDYSEGKEEKIKFY